MTEIEDKAKAQGWTPKENFKGDPDKWRTAEEFIKVGEGIQAVQSERNEKLLADIEDLRTDMKELTSQQFKVIAEAKKKGYDDAVADLEKKQRAAAEEGDVDRYDKLAKEKQNLKKPEQPPPKIDPEFTQWHKENQWYKPNNPDPISMAADTYGMALMKQRPDLHGTEYYKEVEKHIKLIFPDTFKPSNGDKLDTSEHRSRSTGKKDYDSLPEEAKKACDMQVEKYGITQEGYVKQYFKAYGE